MNPETKQFAKTLGGIGAVGLAAGIALVQVTNTVLPTAKPVPFLEWDAGATAYRIEVGPARGVYTNSVTLATNRTPRIKGAHYRITAITDGKVDWYPQYWPPIETWERWVQTSPDMTNWTDVMLWKVATDKPQEFLRIDNRLIRRE